MMNHKTTAQIMVMLERPPVADLHQKRGHVKDAALRANAKQQRDDLIDWVHEQGLANQLMRIDEPTSVNLLHIEGTSELAAALQCAPCILCVALVADFQLRLLDA